MKVMILANNDIGLYQFRKELIEELLKQHEVVIALPDGDFIKPLEDIGCKFIDTPVDRRGINPVADLKLFHEYRGLLKQEEPDLVITYTIKPNVYGGIACRVARIPYAVNITGLGTAFENGGMLKRIVTVMNKVACKKAKVVFFENEENRQIFIKERIVRESKTHRLNGAGVNLEKYQVTEYPRGEKIKFLFMGRVMAEKGINELFGAMKRLTADGINCELDVLGGYEEDYKKKIQECENEGWLHYHGYQKDVRPFIEKCHCFVLPSWHEGMANTNLESAASGRPIITSNIPGCMEAVIDGKTGYLAERKNAEDLYRVMKKFAELPYEERKAMGLAGRERMEAVFDKKIIVKKTLSCLNNAVKFEEKQ
ncbi:MAG TPA: glycosyltransferase family 4 protein [Candidatus Scybalocola faecipullorum]|nr:glycosyltransferase family 4 protein [Candidatus Scybalocola faecipullorum]